jgi:hypothetical protein
MIATAENTTQGKSDPRRWAKKILAEQTRKGGRRYSPAVLAMAQRALDNPGGKP